MKYIISFLLILNSISFTQQVIQYNGYKTVESNSFKIPILLQDHISEMGISDEHDNPFSWQLKFTASGRVFKDISFANLQTGYIVTELGAVYKTINGGENWTSVMNLGFPYYWYGVYAVSPDTVVISGFNNQDSITRGVVRWSYNGGSTWQPEIKLRKPGNGVGWMDKIHFFNSNTGLVMNGLSGGCFVTLTGGKDSASWLYVTINPDMGWFAGNIDAHASGRVYATGIHFAISNTYGNSWMSLPSADPVFDGGVDFLDYNILYGWTGGGQISSPVSGWVHRTTNEGITWSDRLNTFAYPIRALKFFDQNTGFAIGGNVFQDAGGLWLTTNAGTNWTLDVNTNAEMFSIISKNTNDSIILWSVGSTGSTSGYTGKAYKTVIPLITGLEMTSSKIPEDFLLYQNYPNPFNPETQIRFDVRTAGNVKLSITDINSQHVITLLDKNLTPGKYSINWNASQLASGIYFVRLESGVFSSTKKIVFTK